MYIHRGIVLATALLPSSGFETRENSRARERSCVRFERASLIRIRHTRYYVDDNGPRINIHAGDAHKCYRCIVLLVYYARRNDVCVDDLRGLAAACIARTGHPGFNVDDQDHRSRGRKWYPCLVVAFFIPLIEDVYTFRDIASF